MDGAVVHALLQTRASELPTDLVVPRQDLYRGLVFWLGLHEPTSAWFTAEGNAAATGLVPALFDGSGEAISTFGLFEAQGVALFARLAAGPDDSAGSVAIGVRAHGDLGVGARLRAATLACHQAGPPGLAGLRVRAIQIEHPLKSRAGEIVLTREYTRFLLDWPS